MNIKLKIYQEYEDLLFAGKPFVYSTRFILPQHHQKFPAVPVLRLFLGYTYGNKMRPCFIILSIHGRQ
jgi:hypothetical protein